VQRLGALDVVRAVAIAKRIELLSTGAVCALARELQELLGGPTQDLRGHTCGADL
jgi:hypothetical protein